MELVSLRSSLYLVYVVLNWEQEMPKEVFLLYGYNPLSYRPFSFFVEAHMEEFEKQNVKFVDSLIDSYITKDS